MTVQLQQSNIANWDDLFNRVSVFLCECNGEQIRHSPNQFAELCHVFTNKLVSKRSEITTFIAHPWSPLTLKACQ